MLAIIKKDLILKLLLIATLSAQIFFWSKTNHIKPDMIIVADPPKIETATLLSLGDTQFYFRFLTLKLQNSGDSWGRFTALKKYNYEKLAAWFYLLDEFDEKSNFVPSIASYYYSQTQTPADTIHIVNYLRKHAHKDIRNKWWWLYQATYIANYKLKDKKLALELAYELNQMPADIDAPLWVRQMVAFIHEKEGEYEAAKTIIVEILENNKDFTNGELNFMSYFLTDRLKNPQFFEEVKELIIKRRMQNKK
jgi:tetratricopeptide (TPR) repeat protein